MIALILQNREQYPWDGNQRTFSDVDDCIYCLDKLMIDPNIISQVFNIGPDEETITINELYSMIANKMKFNLAPFIILIDQMSVCNVAENQEGY